jgi:hypothetical protein
MADYLRTWIGSRSQEAASSIRTREGNGLLMGIFEARDACKRRTDGAIRQLGKFINPPVKTVFLRNVYAACICGCDLGRSRYSALGRSGLGRRHAVSAKVHGADQTVPRLRQDDLVRDALAPARNTPV